jgi:hypothetical protein
MQMQIDAAGAVQGGRAVGRKQNKTTRSKHILMQAQSTQF